MSRTDCARQRVEAVGAKGRLLDGPPVFRTIRSAPFMSGTAGYDRTTVSCKAVYVYFVYMSSGFYFWTNGLQRSETPT
eukprot:5045149-Prymnesium_polylepis.1